MPRLLGHRRNVRARGGVFLFYISFRNRKDMVYARDLLAIVLANLLAFVLGEWLRIYFVAQGLRWDL